MLSLCLVTLCLAAASHLAGCAAPGPAAEVGDPELTPDEIAALPDAAELDHDGLADAIAAEPPETDAATFDTDEAAELTDVAVDDTDETAAAPRIQPRAALLKFGLHPRASDALRSASPRRASCRRSAMRRRRPAPMPRTAWSTATRTARRPTSA
jgi:hypothetical protein